MSAGTAYTVPVYRQSGAARRTVKSLLEKISHSDATGVGVYASQSERHYSQATHVPEQVLAAGKFRHRWYRRSGNVHL